MAVVEGAYCAVEDLLTGDIPLPGYLNPAKFCTDAADEIDSHIGRRYKTPIPLSKTKDGATEPFEEDDFVISRPVRLLIKRINTHLATGRLILAVTSPQEDARLHAYGWSLVKESLEAIASIVDGSYPLEGAEENDGQAASVTAPLHYNEDAESAVEAFQNRIVNPYYTFPDQYVRGYHG